MQLTEVQGLDHLPEPIRRYLEFSHVLGKRPIVSASFKTVGHMRRGMNPKWLQMSGQESMTTSPPGFIWRGRVSMFPGLWVSGTDSSIEGRGKMVIKLMSLVRIGEEEGDEADQAELMRFLSEVTLIPTFWLSPTLRWETVDDSTAGVALNFGATTTKATVRINENDEMSSLSGQRFMSVGHGRHELRPWTGRMKEYREVNGFRVPTAFEVAWNLEGGDFTYFKGRVENLRYAFEQQTMSRFDEKNAAMGEDA